MINLIFPQKFQDDFDESIEEVGAYSESSVNNFYFSQNTSIELIGIAQFALQSSSTQIIEASPNASSIVSSSE